MPTSREIRLPEVERLEASGMPHADIAAQLGVHYSTIAEDMATVRHRLSLGKNVVVSTSQPVGRESRTSTTGTWSVLAQCESAWTATTNEAGLYKLFLSGATPEPFNWPNHLSPLCRGDLIYVGRATNLRTRAKHHKLPTAGSTLRRTLASLMAFPGVWHGKSAHPRLAEEHDFLLTEWMSNNLLMSFGVLDKHETLDSAEALLRNQVRAPLNKDSLTPEQLHSSAVGKRWKANAVRL